MAATGVLREVKQEQNPRGREHAANEHGEVEQVEDASTTALAMRAAVGASGSAAPPSPPANGGNGDAGTPVAAHVYFGMQQKFGNRAVQRMLDPTVQRADAGDEYQSPPMEGDLGSGATEQMEGTEGCDDAEADAPIQRQEEAVEAPIEMREERRALEATPIQVDAHRHRFGDRTMRVKADLNVVHVMTRTVPSRPLANDKAYAESLSPETTITRGGGTPPYGKTWAEITITNRHWGVSGDTVHISATVEIAVKWDVNSGGKTNVDSAQHEAITKETYKDIRDSLDPTKGTGTNNPSRDKAWNETITIKHEMFHTRDAQKTAEEATKAGASWLNSQPISIRGGVAKFFGGGMDTGQQVEKLLDQLGKKIAADAKAAFVSIGEDPAYADGAGDYNTLVKAIDDRAKTEKWDEAAP